MFLLQIKKNKIKKESLTSIFDINISKNKIKKQFFFLKKTQDNLIQILTVLQNNSNVNYENSIFIKYILGISISKTNNIIYLSDTTGHIKFFCNSGQLDLDKKVRKKTKLVIIKLVNFINKKLKSVYLNEHIALHLKNVKKRFCYSTLNLLLERKYKVDVLKIKNNQPHNGCRPRKLKRKKRKKINFHKKK